jgi:hypothetical protein
MKVTKDPPREGEANEYMSTSYFKKLMGMLGADPDPKTHIAYRDALDDTLNTVSTITLGNPVSQAAIEALRPIWAPWVFRNYRPYDYPNIKSLINDTITALRGQRAAPELDPQGKLTAAEEAFSMALGLPTENYYFQASPYSPSDSSDKGARYYRLNPEFLDADLIRQRYADAEVGQKFYAGSYDRDSFPYSMEGEERFQTIGPDPIQNYKVSIGQDDRGRYASLYDAYDFEGPANYMVRPFEIYDRVYLDE